MAGTSTSLPLYPSLDGVHPGKKWDVQLASLYRSCLQSQKGPRHTGSWGRVSFTDRAFGVPSVKTTREADASGKGMGKRHP